MADILSLNNTARSDESVTDIQYHSYSPYTTSFNYNDEIRIVIQQQDLYTLPSESYIHLEGELRRKGAPPVVGADLVPTPEGSNFFIAHMFSDIRYEINGFEVDRCKNPGIVGLLKGYSSISSNDNRWTNISSFKVDEVGAKASIECRIPLNMFLGFAEDYKKIVMNAKQELILCRNRNDLNCFHGATDNLEIVVKKITWKIPHVQVSDHAKLMLLRNIEKSRPIPLTFRSWDLYEYPALPRADKHMWSVKTSNHLNKPRYIIVGFQTNRGYDITKDASLFDHCDISDIKVHLNSNTYPYESMNCNFADDTYMQAFLNYMNFRKSYYHDGSSVQNGPYFNFSEYKAYSPIFVIDCSRQNEAVKSSMVDIRLEITARKAFPSNTTAYCLVIHDNIVTYNPYTNVVNRIV